VNCSNCGASVAPDAGFCRNCGAILRGKAASATLIPTAPFSGPAPPASGPEPRTPPLADAGYWAPPQSQYPPPGYQAPSQSQYPPPGYQAPELGPSLYAGPTPGQGYGGPVPQFGYPPPAPPAGPHTVPTWGGGAPWGGAVTALADLRYKRRLQGLDLAAFFGSVAVFCSLFMPWYQIGVSGNGISVSVSLTALADHAGGWRWAIFVCSLAVVVELLATLLIFRVRARGDWPHRSVLGLLCAVDLALVIAAMAASPFNSVSDAYFGVLKSSLGAGAYVAIVGALIATGAAAARLFTGPPALTR